MTTGTADSKDRSGATAYPFCRVVLKRTFLALAGIALFAGGGLAGHFATTDWPGPVNWFGRPLDSVVLEKLTSELQLTPDQATRVAPVITNACSDMRMVSEERRAEQLELIDEVSQSIAPTLSPAQQRKLEALEKDLQNRPAAKRDERIVALF